MRRHAPWKRVGTVQPRPPRLPWQTIVLDPTERAMRPREKYWRGAEAFAIGDDAGWYLSSRRWTSDRDGAHWRT
jgi:hypothetical protein